MRRLFTTIFIFITALSTQAASYYFSSTTGKDENTREEAQNPSTPWKTLKKLNFFIDSLVPGDAVFFKRGDVFDGAIIVSRSGLPGSPILFSAYGSGNKPVINGFRTLSDWSALGGNIYETPVSSGVDIQMVTINGIVQAMGRYPNYNNADGGYLTVDKHNGIASITDAALSSSPNWKGAEIVIRKVDWVLDRNPVTGHAGSTIDFISSTGHETIDGNGYFIQNSALALDRQGEWYYDPVRSKLRIYATANPSSLLVKASVHDKLVTIAEKGYIVFDNLSFHGADKEAFYINRSRYVTIQNCSISFTGFDAIQASTSSHIKIYNNAIDHSGNSGIRTGTGCSHALIRKNTVSHSGILPGMGVSNNQQMVGIFAGDGATISTIDSNIVRNSGYCGITFTGDSTIVKNNLIDSFCLTVNDGGGIYTWGGFDKVGRKITGNIVLNGVGQPFGTKSAAPAGAVGIYLDDRSANVDIQNNTVAHNSRSGVMLHNSHDIILTGNTLYNNAIQLSMNHDGAEPGDPIRNITATNNILFSKAPEQFMIENGSVANDISSFGSFKNNYYISPLGNKETISVNYKNGSLGTAYAYYDLAGWSGTYSHDVNSKASPLQIFPYIISSTSGQNKFLNGAFTENINGATCFSAPNCEATWDASGKLNGGALKIASKSSTTNSLYVYFEIGSIQAGTRYLIKFSAQRSVKGKTVKAYIRNSDFQTVSPVKYFNIGDTRSENEFLYVARSTSGGAFLVLEITEKDGPLWIDNLDMRSVNAVTTNADEHIRFEYNASGTNKIIPLSGTYIDAKNNRYQNSINVAPFSSVVLMKLSEKARPVVSRQ